MSYTSARYASGMQHISVEKVVGAVSIEKDVDGFHPMNVGRLAMQGRAPRFVSCTPKACIELLLRSGVEMDGKHAVVLGRSNVVGMPAALLLQVCFVLWNLILIISLIILYLRLYRLSLIISPGGGGGWLLLVSEIYQCVCRGKMQLSLWFIHTLQIQQKSPEMLTLSSLQKAYHTWFRGIG